MFKTIKRILGYYRPIIPSTKLEFKSKDEALAIDLKRQQIKLECNEEKSLALLKQYIKRQYEYQGLLPTERQLNEDTLKGWNNLKNSNLVDGFNNFTPGILEVL